MILGVFAVAVWASFVTYWPYNLKLSLNNYAFENFDASGWTPISNSLWLADQVPGAYTDLAPHYPPAIPLLPGLA